MAFDVLELAAELVAIPSVSFRERALADRLESELVPCSWLEVTRVGDNVVARTQGARDKRLVVAGHLDTVPSAGNARPRREGDVLWGLGAADTKGSLAVMLDLACSLRGPAVDVTWCFYAREEVEHEHSGLAELWHARPDLMAADAAVLCEPTGAVIEAGCQGTMRMAVDLAGVRAHTARPFTGRNAIHRLGPLLERVAGWPGRSVILDGCEFVEQLQAVDVRGGVAGNVVPDLATIVLNYRFAPDRDADSAARFLGELLGEVVDESLGDRLELLDAAGGAPPALSEPLLTRLVELSQAPPRAKVGWTDVASFWARGVPAVNLGAGDPLLAHHRDERVERGSLERLRALLATMLGGE